MNAIAAIFKGFGFALVSIGTLPFLLIQMLSDL